MFNVMASHSNPSYCVIVFSCLKFGVAPSITMSLHCSKYFVLILFINYCTDSHSGIIMEIKHR